MLDYKDKDKENEEKEDPVKVLEEIENKYSSMDYVDAPESLGLEKREFKDMSDDELLAEVTKKVGNKEDGIKEIDDNYSKKIKALEDSSVTIVDNSKVNEEKINKAYDMSSKNMSDDALKRGLARSSIIIGQIAGIENERAKELTLEMKSVNEKLETVEKDIAGLYAAKEEALDAFDIKYAKSIEEALATKKEELEKQRQEVIEFNNKVDELEAEYKLSLDKQKQAKAKSNIETKAKYGYTSDELKMAEEKYDYMIEYLNKMSKADALNLLLSDEKIQSLLGEKFMAVYAYTRNRT